MRTAVAAASVPPRRAWARALLFGALGALLPAAAGGRTLHVDDDAPGDPAPHSTHASDPLEDGSAAHPFDAIAEALAVALPGDVILLEDGVYQGPGNRDLDMAGKAVTVRSRNGAPRSVVNAQAKGRAFVFQSGEGPGSRLEGLVIGNGLAAEGGGVLVTGGSSPTIAGCVFLGHRAERGAALLVDGGGAEVRSSVFHSNRATDAGGAVLVRGAADVLLRNVTLSRNAAPGGTALAVRDAAFVRLADAIAWDSPPLGPALAVDGTAELLVEHSDVRGGRTGVALGPFATLTWGAGNLDADPLFLVSANPLFSDAVGYDLRLPPHSPCVDAGTPGYVPLPGETDPDGDPRVVGAAVDMGADEVLCTAGGTGPDCNGNGVPDDCEHDCNGSGLPDPCDLLAGTSADAGADGIPDECFPVVATWIDDDAPFDPGPGDPLLSDPLENGSPFRPFDSLQEGLDAALLVDFVFVQPGTYAGPGNRDVSFRGKANQLHGVGGPQGVVVDLQGLGRGLVFEQGEAPTAHVKGLTFVGGSADVGGAILARGGFPKIIECVFLGNAAQEGGAVAFEGNDQTLRNCILAGNVATLRGGAILVADGSTAFVRGCTIVDNVAGTSGGGLAGDASGAAGLRDSIVWHNQAPAGPQVSLQGGGSLTVTHSNVQGGPGAVAVSGGSQLVWGSPNLDAAPAFADRAGGDYHATVLSPGLDLGAPFYEPQPGETDVDGDPRIDGPFMDQGADEIVCQQDLGHGGPGTSVLKVCGRDLADGPTALLLTGGKPFAPAWILVGLVANPAPLKGGLLVPNPPVLTVTVPLDAQGRLHVPGITAAVVFVPVVLQVVHADAQQPAGFGFSNAVRVSPP